MNTALALRRLALERGWTLGLLFVVFCGGALIGGRFGLQLPLPVTQWAGAGLLFGMAVIVVSAATHSAGVIQVALAHRAQKRSEAAQQALEYQHVLAALGSLSINQAVTLDRLLSSGRQTFQVPTRGDMHQLVELGLLKVIRAAGPERRLCQIHPAVITRRAEIMRQQTAVGAPGRQVDAAGNANG